MSRLSERLKKLEGPQSDGPPYFAPVAVLSGPFPTAEAEREWGLGLLSQHGWAGWPASKGLQVRVIAGEPDVLLAPTALCDMTPEQVLIWEGAKNSFPHAAIGDFLGNFYVDRCDSREEWERGERAFEAAFGHIGSKS